MTKRSFKNFVEQELGSFPNFLIYAILEWILIIFLFIDGFIAFLSNQFAKFFDLTIPCLLCTRIDHVLVHTDSQFYYNNSICDSHKKNISSLAYCHVHKKLSEIKHMCEGCLLSFATQKESDTDTYKSLIGILHKDLDLLIADEQDLPLTFPVVKKDENFKKTQTLKQHCSCCGEFLKIRSDKQFKNSSAFTAPTPSPRISEFRGLDEDRTPSSVRGGNKFFGIPLSDSAQNSPRWSFRSLKKTDMIDSNGSQGYVLNGESILNDLKKEVRLDKKSLIDLYMELDEERNASAVAANNAMAMITRLQAEKAAVQMEALQYQRMMDEQAEFDQEALQSMNSELVKRDEDLKELEQELEIYREKFGSLTEENNNLVAETNLFLDAEACSSSVGSNQEENGEEINQKLTDKTEETSCLGQMKSSEEESTAEENGVEQKGEKSKDVIVKELTEITERLSVLESNGELLKHLEDVLDVSEGQAILLQISQNLHMLRSFVAMPSDSMNL